MKRQIGLLWISLLIVALFVSACDVGPKLQSEVFSSAEGGFEYQIPVDYNQEENAGDVQIFAPGEDSNTLTGPAYLLTSLWDDEIVSLEGLQSQVEEDFGFDDVSTPKSIRVGGYPGLQSDIAFTNGNDMVGKMVVVFISPTYQFVMLGASTTDLWKNEIPVFYKILGSVRFSD